MPLRDIKTLLRLTVKLSKGLVEKEGRFYDSSMCVGRFSLSYILADNSTKLVNLRLKHG